MNRGLYQLIYGGGYKGRKQTLTNCKEPGEGVQGGAYNV